MASPPDLTVISLGGGVQSSVMALMAGEGAFDRPPDCAIFADTHWEPPSIYAHLDWLSMNMSFPLYMVDNGRSLREDAKALTNHSGNHSFVDLPVYLKGRNGEGDGIGRRAVHRALQDRTCAPQDTRAPGAEEGTAGSLTHRRRAVAWHLHRRGRPHEAVTRQVDYQPLPAHRCGHVPQGLHRLVDGPLRQAAGTLGLRRLPLPVTPAMGADQAQVAGAVR